MKNFREAAVIATMALTMVAAGCAKKVAATPPPPVNSGPPAGPGNTSAPPSTATERPAAQAESAPPARSNQPDAATRARIDQLLARIEDAYFDYNEHSLRPDAVKALQADSTELRDILKDYPNYKLTIEGYCDERGSAEYNIALGEKRAESAKDYLVQVGIPAGQLGVVSYGKEKPVCEDHDEACWQKNRRIHIVANATN